MLSPAEQALLAAFKAALRERLGRRLERLVLFGSRARGAGRDDSDLDVMVVVRDLTRSDRAAVLDVGADLSVDHGLVLSPVVVDAAAEPTRLRAVVDREGVAL